MFCEVEQSAVTVRSTTLSAYLVAHARSAQQPGLRQQGAPLRSPYGDGGAAQLIQHASTAHH